MEPTLKDIQTRLDYVIAKLQKLETLITRQVLKDEPSTK